MSNKTPITLILTCTAMATAGCWFTLHKTQIEPRNQSIQQLQVQQDTLLSKLNTVSSRIELLKKDEASQVKFDAQSIVLQEALKEKAQLSARIQLLTEESTKLRVENLALVAKYKPMEGLANENSKLLKQQKTLEQRSSLLAQIRVLESRKSNNEDDLESNNRIIATYDKDSTTYRRAEAGIAQNKRLANEFAEQIKLLYQALVISKTN